MAEAAAGANVIVERRWRSLGARCIYSPDTRAFHLLGRSPTSLEVYISAGLATLALPLGLAAWSAGTVRRRARRRFVDRVGQGGVLGWQIVPIDPHDELPLPLEPEKPVEVAGLLVRGPRREGVYRVRADQVVVARVPGRPSSVAIRNLPAIRAA